LRAKARNVSYTGRYLKTKKTEYDF